jgi:hypothetical protein
MLFGGLLLYHFRILERQWGSRSYLSCILVTTAWSHVLNMVALYVNKVVSLQGLDSVPVGPYGSLFALLCVYYCQIPVLYQFKVLGWTLSDHFFLQLLAFQVLVVIY